MIILVYVGIEYSCWICLWDRKMLIDYFGEGKGVRKENVVLSVVSEEKWTRHFM